MHTYSEQGLCAIIHHRSFNQKNPLSFLWLTGWQHARCWMSLQHTTPHPVVLEPITIWHCPSHHLQINLIAYFDFLSVAGLLAYRWWPLFVAMRFIFGNKSQTQMHRDKPNASGSNSNQAFAQPVHRTSNKVDNASLNPGFNCIGPTNSCFYPSATISKHTSYRGRNLPP